MENLNTGAIEFLREKKILAEDKTQWIVKFQDGNEIDICDLFTEFKSLCEGAQQPVRKTLDELQSEAIKKYPASRDSENEFIRGCRAGYVYASQTKAVEPQEGWVSIKDRMPEENQLVDIWKHDSYRDDWFRQINVIYKDEHICEFSHWMPSFLPPTQTNNLNER